MENQKSKRKHDVLISYSTKDKNVADAIVVDLEQHGIRCWYAPRDILPGEHWVSAIKNGIAEAQAVVLVFTEDSNASAQVMNEIAMAFNAGKTIIPFRLSDGEMNPELEYYLSRVHWLDAVSSSVSQDIERLRMNVLAIVKPDSPAPAVNSKAQSAVADNTETEKTPEKAEEVKQPEPEPAEIKQAEPAVKKEENINDNTSKPEGLSFEEYVNLSENDEINEKIRKSTMINYIVGGVGFVLFIVFGLVFCSIFILAGLIISFINLKKKNYPLAIAALVLEIPMLLPLIWTIPVMKGVKELNDGYASYNGSEQ